MKTGCAHFFLFGAVALAAALQLGCAGKSNSSMSTTSAVGKDGKLSKVDRPMRCDAKGKREVQIDLNQDSIPDVRKVYAKGPEGEVLVCREADLNYDGVKDLIYMYDELGRTTRDEVDLDKDGRIDIISTYADGKVVKQELDSNSDGMIDSVRYLENDQPVRFEADTDGDRRIDHWEYYEDGRLVRIGTDKDGDGKAEEWSRDDAAVAAAGPKDKPSESTEDATEQGEDAAASEQGEDAAASEQGKDAAASEPKTESKDSPGKKDKKDKKAPAGKAKTE
ncbi:MAG: WD40 repeat domain-containing protein [Myxococcota bacterium]|jgi:hypothetical protein|nr:WD40 repeat domain-containing protein [Myxococcota bacterium]